jgi:hypothetical protein
MSLHPAFHYFVGALVALVLAVALLWAMSS